jgi:hypothetical protein
MIFSCRHILARSQNLLLVKLGRRTKGFLESNAVCHLLIGYENLGRLEYF